MDAMLDSSSGELRETLSFGERLRQQRLERGLTQEELAERAGLSVRGLSDLERGARRAPYRHTLERLADALGLSAAERAALRAGRRRAAAPASAPADAAPLSREAAGSAAVLRSSLPIPLTTLVGREQEVAELRGLLAAARLLTLTGAGGVGKTRLALSVAAEVVETYPDEVWLVELAPLAEPGLVPQAVAETVGVREQPGRGLLETLVAALRTRHLLLVLDNCEHLIEAVSRLAHALLSRCPGVRLLATSREPLWVPGEFTWRVPPLSVPDLQQTPSFDQLAGSPAVQLFLERAQAVRSDFHLTPQNAPAVAQVCAGLDGLPLAIELAAARVNVLTVEQIAARLAVRFRLLRASGRTAPPRHQTLRASVEWSYNLLGSLERRLFRRLSVFAGGWTLEAAEAVCPAADLDPDATLDLLAGLVDKSLVVMTERDGAARYRLLETLREYAQDKLREAAEEAALLQRHAEWCLALVEAAAPHMQDAQQAQWLARLEMEQDNLRAALTWCESERGSMASAIGLRLVDVLHELWFNRLRLVEGRRWTERVLGIGGPPTLVRARVLNWAAQFALHLNDGPCAEALAQEALRLSCDLGYLPGKGQALTTLGSLGQSRGEYESAVRQFEEAQRVCRAVGDDEGAWRALNNLAETHRHNGALDKGQSLFEQARSIATERGDGWGVAQAVRQLGLVAEAKGDYARAAELLEESLVLWQAVGATRGRHWSLLELGRVVREQGDRERARALMGESLRLCREAWDQRGIARCLEGFAGLAASTRQAALAVTLFGAADALRAAIRTPIVPIERPAYERSLRAARDHLDDNTCARAWAKGRAMTLEQAIDVALRGTTARCRGGIPCK